LKKLPQNIPPFRTGYHGFYQMLRSERGIKGVRLNR
jgi:hypothetical protein